MQMTIKEVALDYIGSDRERNFYAAGKNVTLHIHGGEVDVESIWYSKGEDKVYLHCGCEEFEGDIDIESLSDENHKRVKEVLRSVYITPDMVPDLMKRHEGKPLVFLFRARDAEREEMDAGLSREDCFRRCIDYFTLDEFGQAWNDTDDEEQRVPDIKDTWCYVSQPEPPKKKYDTLLKESIVLLAADLYQTIYDRDDCDGWGVACDEIIRHAEQFEKELVWQEHDERDYMEELETYKKKVLDELNG